MRQDADGDDGRAGEFEVRLCEVLPEAVGGGYGHALITRLEEVARRHGASRLVLPSTSTARDFYDYEDKYVDGKSQILIPAKVPGDRGEEFRRLAIAARGTVPSAQQFADALEQRHVVHETSW